MAFIYWKSENLEIQLLHLLSHPEPAPSLLGDHQIIYYKHHHFSCCYFLLICNTPSPKPSGLRRHRTRFKLPKFSLVSVYLAQKGSKGERRTHLSFFHARQGAVPCWPIPAVSPHPTRIPSQSAGVGHGLPLASRARAPLPQLPLNEPPEPFQLSRQEESGSVLRVMTRN